MRISRIANFREAYPLTEKMISKHLRYLYTKVGELIDIVDGRVPKKGERWTVEDDQLLIKLCQTHISVSDMVKILERREPGIGNRIKVLRNKGYNISYKK